VSSRLSRSLLDWVIGSLLDRVIGFFFDWVWVFGWIGSFLDRVVGWIWSFLDRVIGCLLVCNRVSSPPTCALCIARNGRTCSEVFIL